MDNAKQPRRYAANEAGAVLKSVKGSVQKAGLVLELIRGRKVETALANLQFCNRRLARDAHKLLQSAIANAENNHDLNVDKLVVKEAKADKSYTLKRFSPRARGRAAKILKPRCHLTIVVAEESAPKIEKKAPKAKPATAKATTQQEVNA